MEPAACGNVRRIGRLAGEDLLVQPVVLRHDREKCLGVRVLRRSEDLFSRADLDDPAEVHHRDAVGDVPCQAEIVSDDEDRHSPIARQAQQQLQDLAADRGVER